MCFVNRRKAGFLFLSVNARIRGTSTRHIGVNLADSNAAPKSTLICIQRGELTQKKLQRTCPKGKQNKVAITQRHPLTDLIIHVSGMKTNSATRLREYTTNTFHIFHKDYIQIYFSHFSIV